MSRKTLYQLYEEHTGKVSDKWSLYLTEYDRLFNDYRDRPIQLLEIGIQNGGSLEIWSKYFSNATALIGCDINPDCTRLIYEDPRIGVIVGDANDAAVSERVFECSSQFDIIIDDGSHLSSDIVRSFALYFPRLVEGGIFVVEDLHCSYWSQFEGGLFFPYSSIAFFKRLADVISHEHWGIQKARADILTGIFKSYDCMVDAEILSQIHSVEFINSVCVIRKAPASNNILGHRVIAGSTELVVIGHHKLLDTSYKFDPTYNQSGNPWSIGETIQHTEQAVANLIQSAAEREQQVADLEAVLAAQEQEHKRIADYATEREHQVADLEAVLAAQEQEHKRIADYATEREQQVADLEAVLAAQEQEHKRIADYATEREQQVADLEDKLFSIKEQLLEAKKTTLQRINSVFKKNVK